GASRLIQRIGRSNHRLDLPSRAILVPGNRFEVLECRAAIDAIRSHELDGRVRRAGGLDVLAQHILGMACAAPFRADDLYDEVRLAAPYQDLARQEFDDALGFVETGGYALSAYPRWHRLRRYSGDSFRVASPRAAQQYRMNIGTIVEATTLKIRLGRAKVLGEVEEYFIQGLVPGDTFVFAGLVLRFEGVFENSAIVSKAPPGTDPRVPAYEGGRLPLTTELAARVRAILADRRSWRDLPEPVREWLEVQRWRSELPRADGLLVESFPRANRDYLVAYCFEGRNAHQTLGMLLTRRMERAGLHPMGFVATDYAISIWSLKPATDLDALFDQDMLGDDLEEWMADSTLLKRTFRKVGVIAGLIERRFPGAEKSGRQLTISSDLIYDVLRTHQPDHVLLRATRADAAEGLIDLRRVAEMLGRVKGRIVHRKLDRVSPLAVPVLLQIGREGVEGDAVDQILEEAAEELVREAMT
ncbi:MAG TPA: DNA ligase-associated DEXH box helicase, partial [Alphaproteobacteria bacterium]|nr:DNA ligase-associated DEXH box helicase [Alphaproteobacteria bacterium]